MTPFLKKKGEREISFFSLQIMQRYKFGLKHILIFCVYSLHIHLQQTSTLSSAWQPCDEAGRGQMTERLTQYKSLLCKYSNSTLNLQLLKQSVASFFEIKQSSIKKKQLCLCLTVFLPSRQCNTHQVLVQRP